MNTYRQYNSNSGAISKSMEKLSSGYRINRAADDAAGLSISEKMRSQIRGLKQATRNAQDGISFLQTAEGALTEVSDMLTRMKELAVQVQNGTYSDEDKANIGAEMAALGKAISDIYVNTKFNGIEVFGKQRTASVSEEGSAVQEAFTDLKGTFIKFDSKSGIWMSTEDIDDEEFVEEESLKDYGTQGLDADKIYEVNDSGALLEYDEEGGKPIDVGNITGITKGQLLTQSNNSTAAIISYGEDGNQSVSVKYAGTEKMAALTALTAAVEEADDASAKADAAEAVSVSAVEAAITEVNTLRAAYGAQQNQLEHASNNMATTKENLQAAESRVRDVDMAEEMMEYTKNNILLQAAQAMLAQANSQPQGVLQLLQ